MVPVLLSKKVAGRKGWQLFIYTGGRIESRQLKRTIFTNYTEPQH